MKGKERVSYGDIWQTRGLLEEVMGNMVDSPWLRHYQSDDEIATQGKQYMSSKYSVVSWHHRKGIQDISGTEYCTHWMVDNQEERAQRVELPVGVSFEKK